MNRRERRQQAKKNGVPFQPQYKSGKRAVRKGVSVETIIVGGAPKTYEEAYGVGYERFNNKFVTIREVEEETAEATETESTEE